MKTRLNSVLLENKEKRNKWLLFSALVFTAIMLICGIIIVLTEGIRAFLPYYSTAFYDTISLFYVLFKHGLLPQADVICKAMFCFSAPIAVICMFAYVNDKRINFVTFLSALFYGSAIYLFPMYSDQEYWKRHPIETPVLLIFSIVSVLIATVLLIVWIVSRYKQKKHIGDFKIGRTLFSDCALFFIWLIAAIPICDILYLTFNMILNLIV